MGAIPSILGDDRAVALQPGHELLVSLLGLLCADVHVCAHGVPLSPSLLSSLSPSLLLSLPPSLPLYLAIHSSMCLCLSRTLGQSKPTNKMLLPEDTRARLVDRAGDASLAPTSASTSIAWEKRGSRAPRSTSGVSAPSAPRSPRPPLPFLDALPVMVSRTPSP